MNHRQPCAYCNDTGWVCENHFWREAHKCYGYNEKGDRVECGGAGMPCRCNKTKPPWDFKANIRKGE